MLDKIVLIVHIIIGIILVYFPLFMPLKYQFVNLLLYPIILIHWEFNDGECVLNQLEEKLSNKDKTINKGFYQRIFKMFGINISKNLADDIIGLIMYLGFLISCIRLIYKY